MIKVNQVNPSGMIVMLAGEDIAQGALVVSSSGEAVEGAADISTQIICGVAADDADDGDLVYLYPLTGAELEIDVDTTGTKTTFADTDVGFDFDVSVDTDGEFFIDPDDATGPLRLMRYDNDHAKAWVRVANACIEVG